MRAMVELALRGNSRPVPLKEISECQTISEKYLEQLFRELRNSGLVRTVRGAHGGYMLRKHPESISIGDILESAGESVTTVDCLDEESDCRRKSTCLLRGYWRELDTQIRHFLGSVTLSDICEKARNGGVDG